MSLSPVTSSILRQATRSDIEAMHRVRVSVVENRLVSKVIAEADYLAYLETLGRGWVIDVAGEVVAFADAHKGNIWALFVHPQHERQGYGRQLHDTMVKWLWTKGLTRLWLTTAAETRAQRFYEAAGWLQVGANDGELRFELYNPND